MTVPHVDLEILTEDPTLAQLCQDYWATDEAGDYKFSVSELAAQYGLHVSRVSKTVASASVARSRGKRCRSCGAGLVVTSRQQLAQQLSWNTAFECPDCRDLRARREREAAERRKAQQRELLAQRFPIVDSPPIAPEDLSLRDAVLLLALLRSPEHPHPDATVPVAQRSEPFGPGSTLGIEWLRAAYQAGFLHVHPDSDVSAFAWEGDDPARFYLDRVAYYVDGEGDLAVRAAQLDARLARSFRDGPWPEAWHAQWRETWIELGVAECVAYLQLCLAEHGFEFAAGEKTVAVFTDLLATFSIGQIYNFIWRSARDSAAYLMREPVTKKQAANSSIGRIQRAADRARAEGWDVSVYRRDRRLPVSAISHIFFTVAMHIPDLMTVALPHVEPPAVATRRPVPAQVPGAVPGPDGVVYVSPEPVRVVSISRNAPCPCGSGRKFKRCCGAPGKTSS